MQIADSDNDWLINHFGIHHLLYLTIWYNSVCIEENKYNDLKQKCKRLKSIKYNFTP